MFALLLIMLLQLRVNPTPSPEHLPNLRQGHSVGWNCTARCH